MIPYFILYILIVTLLFIGNSCKDKNEYFFYTCVLLLVVFSGLSKNVGFDYQNYLEFFESVKLNQDFNLEYGYRLIIKLVIRLGGEYQSLVLLTALMTNVFMGIFIFRNSRHPNLSLFIYLSLSIFYLATFTAIRQFVAVSLFALAIQCVVERKFWKYAFLMFIGASIHSTLFVLFPLYFVLRIDFKIWHYLLFSITYLLMIKIVEIIFLNYFGFVYYFAEDGNSTDGSAGNASLLIFGFISCFILLFKRKLIGEDSRLHPYINLVFMSLIVILTVYFSVVPSVIILRMSSYFTIAYLIIIPVFFDRIKISSIKYFCFIVMFIGFSGYYIYSIAAKGEKNLLVPYNINFTLF